MASDLNIFIKITKELSVALKMYGGLGSCHVGVGESLYGVCIGANWRSRGVTE